ncbi:MAG: biotin/lipoyl-binding protein, partial [Bryobacteraceae bacterium]
MSPSKAFITLLCASALAGQTRETVKVVSRQLERTGQLPGEFLPYQSVAIYARVPGFVDKVLVDRGSIVKKGDLLATLVAPEMEAKVAEAESKVQTIEAQRAEAEANLLGAESTWQHLKAASATPGAIAGNELILAEKAVDAGRALLKAQEGAKAAAISSVQALKELLGYLNVVAPFDGGITERLVHPGALAGPGAGSAGGPLMTLEQTAMLRLVVAVA